MVINNGYDYGYKHNTLIMVINTGYDYKQKVTSLLHFFSLRYEEVLANINYRRSQKTIHNSPIRI